MAGERTVIGGRDAGPCARRGEGGGRRAARGVRALVAAALLATAALGAGATLAGASAGRATRADLAAMRRRTARLEGEYALAATRRPYIVLDLESGMLRYRLMGMTMREIPIAPVEVAGLVPEGGAASTGEHLAGIFTMAGKEGDPRQNPLTPEQVEAGADDENVANVLPPDPPKKYRVTFRQPIAVVVSGRVEQAGVKGAWGWVSERFGGLFRKRDTTPATLEIAIQLDPATASEFWRSIIPDQRWLVIPPEGRALPQAGQEPPPKPREPRPAPAPPEKKPKKPVPEEGVPFQIPPPVEPPGPNGEGGGGLPPPDQPVPPAPQPPPDGGGTHHHATRAATEESSR
jgi:hypothetical protein